MTGLTNLHVLDGGITAWQNAGAPVHQGPARWDLERQIRLVAGGLVLTGVLASVVAPRAKWLSGAIGAGLTTAALTNTCAMGNLLSRLPYNRDAGTDLPTVIAELTGDRPAWPRHSGAGRCTDELRPSAQARPLASAAGPGHDRGRPRRPHPA